MLPDPLKQPRIRRKINLSVESPGILSIVESKNPVQCKIYNFQA